VIRARVVEIKVVAARLQTRVVDVQKPVHAHSRSGNLAC